MRVFWAILLLGFIGDGMSGVYLSIKASTFHGDALSPQFASTDSWLLRLLGIPRGSERVLASLEKVPEHSPILFISPDNPNATMTYFLLSSLAWPRPFDQSLVDSAGRLPNNPPGSDPAAIMIYGGSNGPDSLGGEKIGKVTLIRIKAP